MHTRALGIPPSTMAAPIKALENAIVSSLIEPISQVNRTQKSGCFEKEKAATYSTTSARTFVDISLFTSRGGSSMSSM